jgi:3-oxoacyl-[acyl-carrier protein] reductase
MVARRRGRIINMSTSISLSAPYYSAYMAAKVGLTRLSECLALEVREYSISVFSIAPGAVRTAMAEEVIASPWDRTMEEAIGIDSEQRWLTPVELSGQLCVTLASGEADALSGRHIDVRQDIAALVQQAEQIVDEDRYALRVRM